MRDRLGIDWLTAGLVVLTTVSMYLVLVLCVRLVGQRSLATMSSFDLGCAIALGAVIGRTALLLDPTLLTGVVAIVTLFTTQIALVRVRRSRWVDRLLNRPPVLLMAGDVPLRENMRAAHVGEDELRQKLRLAGIRDLAEVGCVVLERTGAVSVVRRSERLDPWLFSDVPGAERLHAAAEEPGARRAPG
ncbi:DUF421 domain-containing protein [Blastococcus sp. BMG 814]|uniref:DUF421 domain-containing protein n=1 Tax=Blastococcus carthaginiensis TaxID=3050034 RepID=A0ABT9IGR9_9ACTN|nr:YetF domain-containing protein [Blastococcus carthaginiensis]MDP5184756.1 DUF421 domain-containing protein [Blastococcus carthaginiensis]